LRFALRKLPKNIEIQEKVVLFPAVVALEIPHLERKLKRICQAGHRELWRLPCHVSVKPKVSLI